VQVGGNKCSPFGLNVNSDKQRASFLVCLVISEYRIMYYLDVLIPSRNILTPQSLKLITDDLRVQSPC
jgi:hypothetical protein